MKALTVYPILPTDNPKDLKLVKIECSIIIIFITFSFGLLPYFFRNSPKFLLLGTQFAGGVFLALSMHFLSDSASETSSHFPYILLLSGYFVTAFGDILLFKIKKKKKKIVGGGGASTLEVDEGRDAAVAEVAAVTAEEEEEESATERAAAIGVTILLVLGLCIDSFHNGMDISSARLKSYAWSRVLQISIHNVFSAVGMGIVVLRMQAKRPFWTIVTYTFAFAISAPAGILIGGSGEIVDAIFNNLAMPVASGVFIYISINHLIAKGFKPRGVECSYDTPLRNFFSVLLGVLVSEW